MLSLALAFTVAACSGSGVQGDMPQGSGTRLWSDPETWPNATLPAANQMITIPQGEVVILDTVTPPLRSLMVQGTLVAHPDRDVTLRSQNIVIEAGGTLQIGMPTQPYDRRANIVLHGNRTAHAIRAEDNGLDNDGATRGLHVMPGGALKLFGDTEGPQRARIQGHVQANSSSLVLEHPVSWSAGDKIAISITDFHGVGQTEIHTLAANSSGATLQLVGQVATFRWGLLQYPIDTPQNGSAMSLTQGPFTPASPETPTVLDERATVVNLTRHIVIEGADDAAWQNDGFGAHVMVMGLNSVAQVDGVEFRRVGQRQAMGRYPFHWHMLSYTAADKFGVGGGQYLGDANATNHYLTNSAVWASENRAVTIHGTCGVRVDSVFAVDIKGHAFFQEDGPEERNFITNCVAMKVRDPGQTRRIKLNDSDASGFWLVNPNNTVAGNIASDCDGRGFWNSFADRCFGLSRNAQVTPQFIPVLVFDDNIGHSCKTQGITTEGPVLDEAGNTHSRRYLERYTPGQQHEFFMRRNQVWKNRQHGYLNRVMKARYISWTAADNSDKDFFGSSLGRATNRGALLVGTSLNNATPPQHPIRTAVASYHHEMDFVDLTAINYPHQPPSMTPNGQFVYGGGVFDSSDFYTWGLSMGHAFNPNWRLINAHPGHLTPAPFFDGFPINLPNGSRYWSLAGAIHDPNGLWGPAGNFLVFDTPFYTHSLTSAQPVQPTSMGFVSTPDLFYGIHNIQVDAALYASSEIPMRLTRVDTAGLPVGHHELGDPTRSIFFYNMRNFATARGGRYILEFPGASLPASRLTVSIHNAYRNTDSLILALPWDNQTPAHIRIESGYVNPTTALAQGRMRLLNIAGPSLTSVINDPNGATTWRDTANNRIWVKHMGGLDTSHISVDHVRDIGRPQFLHITTHP